MGNLFFTKKSDGQKIEKGTSVEISVGGPLDTRDEPNYNFSTTVNYKNISAEYTRHSFDHNGAKQNTDEIALMYTDSREFQETSNYRADIGIGIVGRKTSNQTKILQTSDTEVFAVIEASKKKHLDNVDIELSTIFGSNFNNDFMGGMSLSVEKSAQKHDYGVTLGFEKDKWSLDEKDTGNSQIFIETYSANTEKDNSGYKITAGYKQEELKIVNRSIDNNVVYVNLAAQVDINKIFQ